MKSDMFDLEATKPSRCAKWAKWAKRWYHAPGILLEAVERLAEMTDVVRTASVNKVGRLLTIDLLIKSATEEGILTM
jgi:hypothetical protein